MISLYPLIQNETIKMLKKRRFLVVILIIACLVPLFTYAQVKVSQANLRQNGSVDWKVTTQQKITNLGNRLSNSRANYDQKLAVQFQMKQLQYDLDHNVNPQASNGVTFTISFIKNSIGLFLPLLIAVVAADIVSSEQSTGTIKILLTRPVRRWKILLSKLITLVLFISLIVFMAGLLCYAISGLAFGYGGWNMPVLTGFQISGDNLITSNVHIIGQWQYLLMEMGLGWFSCLVIGTLSLMVSVLVRSTAAGMGIMLATLIAGTILVSMVSTWESAKYLFIVNLQKVAFLDGTPTPVPGLTLPFSLIVLACWLAAALMVSFRVFTKQDILS